MSDVFFDQRKIAYLNQGGAERLLKDSCHHANP